MSSEMKAGRLTKTATEKGICLACEQAYPEGTSLVWDPTNLTWVHERKCV